MTPAPGPVAEPTPKRSTRPSGRPDWPQAGTAVVECVVLAVACLNTYWLVTSALSRVYSLSRDDDLLGGMWAVLATIFVLRDSFGKSVAAGVSRMAATSVSFRSLSDLPGLPALPPLGAGGAGRRQRFGGHAAGQAR